MFKLDPELGLRLVGLVDEPSDVGGQRGDLGQPLQKRGLLLHTEGVKVLQMGAAKAENITRVLLKQKIPLVHIKKRNEVLYKLWIYAGMMTN